MFGHYALAEGSAQGINVVVDLEIKMTQKIKDLIAAVDPDAVVMTKVELKKSNTELVGVPVSAVGMFSTEGSSTVEEVDIERINVTILTSLDKFPDSISKLVESSVLSTTRKGRVTVSPMDPAMKAAVTARKLNQSAQADSMRKIAEISETVGLTLQNMAKKLAIWIMIAFLGFVIAFGFMKVLTDMPAQKKYGAMLNQMAEKIANGQGSGAGAGAVREVAMKSPTPESSGAAASTGPADMSAPKDFSIEEEFFKQMSSASIAMLLSDCYWCEKDNYAAWVWSKILPVRRLELLSKWPQLNAYSSFISRLTPKWERYHTDSAYLKPIPNLMISNEDLKVSLKKEPSAWGVLSMMRKQTVGVTLQERIELSKFKDSTFTPSWPTQESALRNLPLQIEITHLSVEDEENLMKNPTMISGDMKRQLPSLIWVALLEKSKREQVLSKVPAQGLAEIWTAPKEALDLILEALPEKKRDLVVEYAAKVPADRQSEWLKEISRLAHEAAAEPVDDKPLKAAS